MGMKMMLLVSVAFLFPSHLWAAETPRLDLNDVSWLWPVPTTDTELQRIISADSLKGSDGNSFWSDQDFQDFVNTVKSDAAKVKTHQINFPAIFETKTTWRVVAFRVDASAPGGHGDIRAQFGERPQLRLILQPVETNGTSALTIHDVAAHLVFTFADPMTGEPDREKFSKIVTGLDRLKKLCEDAGVSTTGKPLGVHPGLAANVAGLDAGVKHFLEAHLNSKNLTAMAIMGLDGPEPWMFLAMAKFPPGSERFGSVPFLPAQMLSFRTIPQRVEPMPVVNNRNPITKELVVPEADRRGVATSVLFNLSIVDLNDFATIGVDASGNTVKDTVLRNRDIADLVANPERSHFFNTDCVSCHTETRRRIRLNLVPGTFAYRVNGKIPKIAADTLPKDDWNVRNFGWFPPHSFIGGGPTVATVTQRTANETADVVEFIENNYRNATSQ